VQVLQKVGWLPVTPIEGLQLPYSTGVRFGLYPTWEGLIAQTAAGVFVIRSYFAAEAVRKRRRTRILQAPIRVQERAQRRCDAPLMRPPPLP
jgi:high-affinity iron transporter